MSVGGLVWHVRQVLDRGHALFGGSVVDGIPTGERGLGLGGAISVAGRVERQMAGWAGALPAGYLPFARDAGGALDSVSGTDASLTGAVRDAHRTDHSGWATSGATLDGAAIDTEELAPLSGTPAARRALIAALRARMAQQQHVISAYRAHDASLAAMVRSLTYGGAGRQRAGVMPLSDMVFGRPRTGRYLAGVARSGLGGAARTQEVLARGADPRVSGAGLRQPRGSVGLPLGALTPDSSPQEVAAAIIHEAHRRGYSPYQTTAILADAIQESNLRPRAVSPNRLWVSIFQQDASYPGRHNPNLAIAGFFDRLECHGGPSSPDIWKSIFWLQQRPGEPSADAAYAHGRQAYLRDVQGHHQRAVALYRTIVGN